MEFSDYNQKKKQIRITAKIQEYRNKSSMLRYKMSAIKTLDLRHILTLSCVSSSGRIHK